ncbi:MAG TPA: CoA-binding protein, partial [Candidatus Moranbacteria bacterium]|nr:CoA-binding protein [Candidatus Moranbacteria bacterium]
ITARKPIVLLKGARSSAGSRAGASHTGALTQPDEVIEAAARKSGIWRARDIDEFITLLDLAEVYGPLKPSQAVIVTNAGGVGVLTADACQAAGVELFAPDRLLREELARKLPAAASVANPIDLLGDASETRYDDALTSLAEEETTKTALVLLTPQENTPVSKVAQAVLSHAKCDDMPIIASFVGGMRVREAISYLQRGGAVHSGSPERAARVLGIVNRAQPYGSRASEFTPERKRADAGEVLAARLRDERRGGLYYSEARELTGLYGLPTAKAWRLDYNSPAEISYPCVVKVDSPSLAHKTDRGGVISGIENEEALVAAAEKLGRLFPGERIIAQEMLPTGEEIILGAARKDGFGPVVLVGYGGIYAEQIGLTEILIPPFSSEEAAEILRASSLGFLFAGARSQAPYNVGELASLAKALGEMLLENPWIKEADLNPLFIYNDQKPAVAVDVKIFSMREEENSFKG